VRGAGGGAVGQALYGTARQGHRRRPHEKTTWKTDGEKARLQCKGATANLPYQGSGIQSFTL